MRIDWTVALDLHLSKPMPTPTAGATPAAPDFLARFDEVAAPTGGWLRADAFIELALYDPQFGYYTRARPRVGTAAGTDFETAASLGPFFGELLHAAALSLCGRDAGKTTLVELGPEAGTAVWPADPAPFAGATARPLGDPRGWPSPAVVFANEVADAQPFRRLRRTALGWVDLGVRRTGCDLIWEPDPAGPVSPGVDAVEGWPLPKDAPTGYTLDAPTGAAEWLRRVLRSPWSGWLILADYGLPWSILTHDRPEGTARAYRHHRLSADLLAHPGEQDLTCHICWDWMTAAAEAAGCRDVRWLSQEAFLVTYASSAFTRLAPAEWGAPRDPRLGQLQRLLHPGEFGQRFQVLVARREG